MGARGRRLTVAMCCVGLLSACVPASAGASDAPVRWRSVVHPSPRTAVGTLTSVTCPTANRCVAVGAANGHLLVESWDGMHWRTERAPAPAGAAATNLSGVTCLGIGDCVAVGSSSHGGTTSTLIERRRGSVWSVVPSVNTPATVNELFAVTCVRATDCVTVGTATDVDETTAATLIEHWDGTSWSSVPSPSPTRQESIDILDAVTCRSASACVAVGTEIMDGNDDSITLVERWNGASWSIEPSPAPAHGNYAGFDAVACPGASECLAVGDANYGALAERWNGARWTVEPIGSPQDNDVSGLVCRSTNDCVAFGAVFNGTPEVEHWNGSHWTIVAHVPAPPATAVAGAACPTTSRCVAVGGSVGGTLTAHSTGTRWSVDPSPSRSAVAPDALYSLACLSATHCVATGDYLTQAGGAAPLIDISDGSTFSNLTTIGGVGTLTGVACTNATRCIAVGWSYPAGAFAAHLDGGVWSRRNIAVPVAAGHSATLAGVACPSAENCIAVGTDEEFQGPPADAAIAVRWDGKRWRSMTIASPDNALLNAVTCTSRLSCTAVGMRGSATLVEHYDGHAWHVVASPTPSGVEDTQLRGISCAAANACIAVGTSQATPDAVAAVVERWDGAHWSIMPVPTDAPSSRLNAVTCARATDCTAVGATDDGLGGGTGTLVEHYDGTSWTHERSPDPAHQYGEVPAYDGIACVTHVCTAVGEINGRVSLIATNS